MTIASSNFTVLGYGIYAGDTPPTALQEIAFTGESLAYSNQFISSSNINSSRQVLDSIQTGYEVSGGLQIEFAPTVYDKLIAASLWASWGEAANNKINLENEGVTVAFDGGTLSVECTITTTTAATFSANGSDAGIVEGQFFQLSAPTNGTAPAPDGIFGIYQVKTVTSDKIAIVYAVDNASPFGADTITTTADKVNIKACMIRAPKDGSSTNMIRQRFCIEKRQTDLTPNNFTYYNNMYVNNFSLNAQSAALLTGSFDFMGSESDMQITASKYDASVTADDEAYTAADTFNGYNAVSHVGDVILRKLDSLDAGVNLNGTSDNQVYMQGLDFAVANNLRGAKAIGVPGNVDVLAGQLGVTGNLNVFFEDKTMYDLFTAQTEFSLSYSIVNEGVGYVFSFPRATINTDSMSSGGNDQDLVESMAWTAMFDNKSKGGYSTGGYMTSIQIDKFI